MVFGGIDTEYLISKAICCGEMNGNSISSFKGVLINGEKAQICCTSEGSTTGKESIFSSEFVKTSKYLDENNNEITYPDIIYNNNSGSTGTIALTKSISNFNFIEIYYADDQGNMKCEKIYNKKDSYATVSLTAQRIASNTVDSQNSLITISGSTISHISSSGGTWTSWDNNIASGARCPIKYVFGYK